MLYSYMRSSRRLYIHQQQTESVSHSPSGDVNLINLPVGTDSYTRADVGNGHELLLHTHPLQALWYFVSHLRYQLLHCSYQFIDVTSDTEV